MTGVIPADAQIHLRHENGAPMRVWLAQPAEIEGVPCAAWFVDFHENGRLDMATIAEACVVRGWPLAPNDTLHLRDDGALHAIHFDPPRSVAGRDAVGYVTFDDAEKLATFARGDATYDASGLLLRRRLPHEAVEEIDGVTCAGYVDFHPNGRIQRTALGAPLSSRHGTLPEHSLVVFDDRGELRTAIVAGACTLGGTTFDARDPVDFTGEAPMKKGWTFYTPHEAPAD